MSMITAAQWVRRGFAAPFPSKYQLDESEYDRIAQLAQLQLDDAEEDLKEAQDAQDADSDDGEKKQKSDGGEDDGMEVEESGSKTSSKDQPKAS